MKKSIVLSIAATFFLLVSFRAVNNSSWSVDNAHSRLGFTINHLGIADIHGSFGVFETKITASKPDFSDAAVELSGDVGSINTGIQMRDDHLKKPDFFDAAQYPKFIFKSNSFKKNAANSYTVTGNLTLHGVTQPVTLTAVLNGATIHPMTKKEMCGFKVTGKIKRSDFGIGAGFPAPMLADEVSIIADLEFSKE
jgi:polyisoprenoid-binding protein YceI